MDHSPALTGLAISDLLTRMEEITDIFRATAIMLDATLSSDCAAINLVGVGVERLIIGQCDALGNIMSDISTALHHERAAKLAIRDIHEVARICRVPVELAETIVFTATGIPVRVNGKLPQDTTNG